MHQGVQGFPKVPVVAGFATGDLKPTCDGVSLFSTEYDEGWLECDGSAVKRGTFAGLFALIGTTWGVGDGVSTFNVPSLARRTLVGRGGSGTGTLANTLGATGGEEAHALITAELAAHTHDVAVAYSATSALGGAAVGAATAGPTTSSSTGSGTAHNNMPPSAVVRFLIKT